MLGLRERTREVTEKLSEVNDDIANACGGIKLMLGAVAAAIVFLALILVAR